jgi:transcription elongation GreA/GreB family factor
MSRAFVKEPEGDIPDDLPALPLSPHPNYVTARGLAQLQQRLQAAEAQRAILDAQAMGARQALAYQMREIRWLQARIASALLVTPASASPKRVGFGCMVTLEETSSGQTWRYRIVGEDEANPEQGDISWVSPLARAIEGRSVGDEALWPRPAGDFMVEIVAITVE